MRVAPFPVFRVSPSVCRGDKKFTDPDARGNGAKNCPH